MEKTTKANDHNLTKALPTLGDLLACHARSKACLSCSRLSSRWRAACRRCALAPGPSRLSFCWFEDSKKGMWEGYYEKKRSRMEVAFLDISWILQWGSNKGNKKATRFMQTWDLSKNLHDQTFGPKFYTLELRLSLLKKKQRKCTNIIYFSSCFVRI